MALLPRMDCRRQPSCWAWSLLAMALMAGGVASTGAMVSGERGFSPRWADAGGAVRQVWGTCAQVLGSLPKAPLGCQEHGLQASQTSPLATASGHSGALAIGRAGG